MKAQSSLCKCVDETDPFVPAYTTYVIMCRIRPEQVWLAPPHQHEELMEEFANLILPKSDYMYRMKTLVNTKFHLDRYWY